MKSLWLKMEYSLSIANAGPLINKTISKIM